MSRLYLINVFTTVKLAEENVTTFRQEDDEEKCKEPDFL